MNRRITRSVLSPLPNRSTATRPRPIRRARTRSMARERRDLVVPLDWVRPSRVGREDAERYNCILAAAIAAEARKGWEAAGPTDFAGLMLSSRCTLRRVIAPTDPVLTGRYLRAATVPFQRRVTHVARARTRATR